MYYNRLFVNHFDYAHLNKPIILLQEDEELYQKETGYYFNIFDYGSFTIASKNEELLAQQIVEHESVDYSRLINLLMTNDSTDSCEKILKRFLKYNKNINASVRFYLSF